MYSAKTREQINSLELPRTQLSHIVVIFDEWSYLVTTWKFEYTLSIRRAYAIAQDIVLSVANNVYSYETTLTNAVRLHNKCIGGDYSLEGEENDA
jgi:hypothetical protein